MTYVGQDTRLINTITGQYPVYLNDIRRLEPGWMIGEVVAETALLEKGYAVVHETIPPKDDIVEEISPVADETGTYNRTYYARSFTESEKNDLLSEATVTALARLEELLELKFEDGVDLEIVSGSIDRVRLRADDRSAITSSSLGAVILKGAGVTSPVIVYRSKNNVNYTLTPDEYLGFSAKAFLAAQYAYMAYWSAKEVIKGAATADEVTVPTELHVPEWDAVPD